MHAIIRLENGGYYTSAVFAHFCETNATDEIKRYFEAFRNDYFVVLNKDKNKLVRQYTYPKKDNYLDPFVLVVDKEFSNWLVDNRGHGCIDFLQNLHDVDNVPREILDKCIKIDADYVYEEYPEIHSQKDIDNLMEAFYGFNFAYINHLEHKEDGTLYVLFEGIWGSDLEMWFSGDLSYSTKNRYPKGKPLRWLDSTMFIEDGFIYLFDDEGLTVDDINSNIYCWFKAKNVKYHVIPKE